MSEILTKEQILAADDLKSQRVELPEWNGAVIIRTMTGQERDKFEDAMRVAQGSKSVEKVMATLIALTAVDEGGKLIFTTEDIEKLNKKSAKPIARLYNVATELNAITQGDVEDLAKN